MKQLILSFLLSILLYPAIAQTSGEEKEVLNLANQVFLLLEKQDTAAFINLHVKGARYYIILKDSSGIRTATRDADKFTFKKDQIIVERMRDTGVKVQIHDRIAMVWVPYDLWVNNTFSHSGVDVFTMMKTSAGWKVASCGYTIEK
jgi:hypothetical protein